MSEILAIITAFVASLFSFMTPTPTIIQSQQSLPSEVSVTANTHYYNISSTSVVGLKKEMSLKGVGSYPGYTSWNISWSISQRLTPNGCSATPANVSLSIDTTLPKWTNVQSGLAAQWSNFLQNLSRHESGHAELARKGAQKLLLDLENLKPTTNCRMLETAAQKVWDSNYRLMMQSDLDYDSKTNHGATEGAVL
jgi:predicted secreted Zn-dependent protease